MERYNPSRPGVTFAMRHYGAEADIHFISPNEYSVFFTLNGKPCYQKTRVLGTEKEVEEKVDKSLRSLLALQNRKNTNNTVNVFENKEELVFCDIAKEEFKVSIFKLSDTVFGSHKVTVTFNGTQLFCSTASNLQQAKGFATNYISRINKFTVT